MKRTLLLIAFSLLLGGVVYARRIAWVDTEQPPVSLTEALKLAETRLQDEKVHYFCLGASLARTFSQGDWELSFSSKEGKHLTVSVGSDRQVRTSELGFEY